MPAGLGHRPFPFFFSILRLLWGVSSDAAAARPEPQTPILGGWVTTRKRHARSTHAYVCQREPGGRGAVLLARLSGPERDSASHMIRFGPWPAVAFQAVLGAGRGVAKSSAPRTWSDRRDAASRPARWQSAGHALDASQRGRGFAGDLAGELAAPGPGGAGRGM